jgi:outer membrane protein OmpA-like peptidoglycan-associated protein
MTVEAKVRADYSARAMTTRLISLGLLAGTFLVSPAEAQMYPGQGITVNQGAINGGGYASPYGRTAYPEVIHLHMPVPVVHHHHVAAKPKPADSDVASTAPVQTPPPAPPAAAPSNSPYPPPLDTLTPDTPAPAPAPARHHHTHTHTTAAAAPAPATTPPATDGGTGGDAALPLTLDPQNEHPVAQPPRHNHNRAASTDAVPATAPASDAETGMTRRSQILFPRGVPDISSTTVDKMRTVAADLTTLLGAGASRVQLDAYGGAPGDKGSDARRLSLKRALGIRQLLIEDGVPSEKIDVRALGGIDDGGAPDRVDVLVRGG